MLVNVICHRVLWLLPALLLLQTSAQANSMEPIVKRLLAEADSYFSDNQLTTPVNQNAYDRYRAVLLLDKGNAEAALGLRAIADRYVELARTANARQHFQNARRFVDLAEQVNGKTSITQQLYQDIRQAEQRALATRKVTTIEVPIVDGQQRIFKLNPVDLDARTAVLVGQLLALGERVQSTREYVQIYARNDAEGRWIYQQLRNASTGYRVRGNIQRSSNPRVELQTPLD